LLRLLIHLLLDRCWRLSNRRQRPRDLVQQLVSVLLLRQRLVEDVDDSAVREVLREIPSGRLMDGAFGAAVDPTLLARAFEELIAELSAAFSCASLGVKPTVRHADSINGGLRASKSADFLLGFLPDAGAGISEPSAGGVHGSHDACIRGSMRVRGARRCFATG
jgi:hypothetical protein